MLNKYKNFVYKKIYRKITDRPISNKLKNAQFKSKQ